MPTPQRSAIRRNLRPDWVMLPAEGRPGPTPPWPLPGRQPKGARAQWVRLWASPQAVEWERLRLEHVVARFVVTLLSARVDLGEIRQFEDRLGLSPMAMRKLQWDVDKPIPGKQQQVVEVTELAEYREL